MRLPRSARRPLQVLRAAGGLLIVAVALRTRPFARVAARCLGRGAAERVDPARAADLGFDVLFASRFLYPRPTCLTRALTLGALLAREHLEARLVVGVRSGDAFGAHASLDHGGVRYVGEPTNAQYETLCVVVAGPTARIERVS